MNKRTYIIIILTLLIAACINNHDTLNARTKKAKPVITAKKPAVAAEKNNLNTTKDTTQTSIELLPEITNLKNPGVSEEKTAPDKMIDTPGTKINVTPEVTEQKTPEVSDEKIIPDKKNDTQKTSIELTPKIIEQNTPGVEDKKNDTVKNEQIYINAEELSDHPEIILNAYKEAYPHLITEVTKEEKDWIVKFKNGNTYFWADGKVLPEKVLPKSDKYTRYTIYPYNMNGRSPELYTEEQIEKLRVKRQPRQPKKKRKIIPGVEGSLYKELYSITTKKSAKKQLTEVKLSGHYITVHKIIADKVKSIDSKIILLAKKDKEVSSFLKSIGRVEAFNWRKIAGTDRMSNHSYGIAIDILPKKSRKQTLYWLWESNKNDKWMLLPQSSLWTPPDQVVKIFLEEGFAWGGHWDRYDTMHFEYRPELIVLYKNLKFNQAIVTIPPQKKNPEN